MASLVQTAASIKTFIGIGTQPAEKVFLYQPIAEKELRALLTTDVYDALVTALPDDDVDAESAARAECLLALRHSLTVLGMRLLDDGGISKMIGHGDFQEELAGQMSVAKAKDMLYAQAMEFIKDLIPDSTALTADELALQFEGNGFALTAVEPHDPYFG